MLLEPGKMCNASHNVPLKQQNDATAQRTVASDRLRCDEAVYLLLSRDD